MTNNVLRNLLNIYSRQEYFGISNPSYLYLDNNDVFRKYIEIDISKDCFEIPIIASSSINEFIFKHNRKNSDIDIINISLYNNTSLAVKKSFDSIINLFFNLTTFNSRLQKVKTSKGEVYYGGKGIILEEDLTPLVFCTISVKKINSDKYQFDRPICYINPKVFSESNLMNNGIAKKLISIFSNYTVSIPDMSIAGNNTSLSKVRIIIDNFDYFFKEPIKPKSIYNNDSMHRCLIKNIEEILT